MRHFVLLMALLTTLVYPQSVPAQEGCAAVTQTATASAPAVVPGVVQLVPEGSVGGAITAAAFVGTSTNRYLVGEGGALRVSGFQTVPNTILELPDLVRDIVQRDGIAYLAAGRAGLVMVPDGAPATTFALPGLPSAVLLDGARGYVAAAGMGGGLHLLDLADPLRPRLLSSAEVFGSASDLALAGELIMVAGGVNGGIEVFSVADPLQPTRIGGLITPGTARALVLHGTRAYVAAGICGLQVLDMSDPTAPRLLGAVPVGGEALDLIRDGDTLYVAAGSGGLAQFNLTNLGLGPQLVASTPLAGNARALHLRNGVLLIAAETGGLFRLSLSAGAPERVVRSAVALSVAHTGTRAVLGLRTGGVQMIDLDIPRMPQRFGFTPALPDATVRALSYATTSERLYAGVDDLGIVTLEPTPTDPFTVTNRLRTPGQVTALLHDPAAEQLYAALGSQGIAIYDLDDPDAPELTATITISGTALGLAQQQQRLVVANRIGLQVIDLEQQEVIGSFTAPGGSFVQGVALSGEIALLADRNGLLLVDLRDPRNPELISSATGFTGYRVITDGERAYVAAGPAGVLAYDLRDPLQPQLIAQTRTPGSALALLLQDTLLLVADEAGGLVVLTISELRERLFLPLMGQG
jgi:hypothetical protein